MTAAHAQGPQINSQALFSADWLELRAAADSAARSSRLERLLRCRLGALQRPRGRPLQVVDLGGGSGANLRHLGPRLGCHQDWLLVDHDPQLLAAGGQQLLRWARAAGYPFSRRPPAVTVNGRKLILRQQQIGLAPLPVELLDADLVTASALLDLTSAAWLAQLAAACRRSRPLLLIALSYSGRWSWTPEEPLDAAIEAGFNRDQRRDKGFGPALGPDAARYLIGRLRLTGYRVAVAASPWRVSGDSTLKRSLLDGLWPAAAGVVPASELQAWAERRAATTARLRLSHLDLLAWPQPRRPRRGLPNGRRRGE